MKVLATRHYENINGVRQVKYLASQRRVHRHPVPWNTLVPADKAKYIASRGALALLAVGALIGFNPNGPFDAAGDKFVSKSRNEINGELLNEKTEAFMKQMPIADRYSMQFLSNEMVGIDNKKRGKGVLLLLGIFESHNIFEPIGSKCLAGTVYDSTPSQIRGREVSGDISAVAGINVDSYGNVSVHPAAPDAAPLKLYIDERGVLLPNDEATAINLTEVYGCPLDPLATNK